ncbi:MAG: hypothetical protein MUO64_19740, partial [Anaerolineales bacterium]|nr:hypothetical protein [Anaerolineales bacterium]
MINILSEKLPYCLDRTSAKNNARKNKMMSAEANNNSVGGNLSKRIFLTDFEPELLFIFRAY